MISVSVVPCGLLWFTSKFKIESDGCSFLACINCINPVKQKKEYSNLKFSVFIVDRNYTHGTKLPEIAVGTYDWEPGQGADCSCEQMHTRHCREEGVCWYSAVRDEIHNAHRSGGRMLSKVASS